MTRVASGTFVLLGLVLALIMSARADNFPSRPLHFILPY